MDEKNSDKLFDEFFDLQHPTRYGQKWGKLTQKDITTLVNIRTGLIQDLKNRPRNVIFKDGLESVYKITKILEMNKD